MDSHAFWRVAVTRTNGNQFAGINQPTAGVRREASGVCLFCLLGRAAASKVNIQQKTALFQWKLEGPGKFFFDNLESLSIFKERKAVFSLLVVVC